MLDHEAIYKAYAGIVVRIDDRTGAWDKDDNLVTLDQSKIDAARVEDKSYLPTDFEEKISAKEIPGFISEGIWCSPSITRDESLAQKMSKLTGCRFENLELYGVATACRELNVPWSTISCVTNYIEASGHQQWKENHKKAAEITSKKVVDYLSK